MNKKNNRTIQYQNSAASSIRVAYTSAESETTSATTENEEEDEEEEEEHNHNIIRCRINNVETINHTSSLINQASFITRLMQSDRLAATSFPDAALAPSTQPRNWSGELLASFPAASSTSTAAKSLELLNCKTLRSRTPSKHAAHSNRLKPGVDSDHPRTTDFRVAITRSDSSLY